MADAWGQTTATTWESPSGGGDDLNAGGGGAANVDWDGDGGGSGDAQFGDGQDQFGQGGDGFGAGDAGGDGGDRACFSCGETGHVRADCPKPATCNQCGEEGHMRADCPAPRQINRDHVPDSTPEAAWENMIEAAKARDSDDVKDFLQQYLKANHGETTYREIQQGLLDSKIKLFFIALERPISGAFTNMDLQGNTGKTYTVSVRFSEKPARPRERDGWPESTEEILTRLDDAGDVVDSGKPRCHNCDEYGHVSKSCPDPEREREEKKLSCNNCGEEHRIRDCTKPRIDRNACKNCGESGHRANECPEPPNPANMTCRKCEETGHMAKDCPQNVPRPCHNCGEEGHMSKECPNPKVIKCRNCDEIGHTGRECPKPRDYSRVQCSNCQEYGHTKVRCKQPPKEEPAGDFGADDTAGGFVDGGGGDGAGWNDSGAAATAAGDDGGW